MGFSDIKLFKQLLGGSRSRMLAHSECMELGYPSSQKSSCQAALLLTRGPCCATCPSGSAEFSGAKASK
eukprot:1863761-Amphidinium_carterae.2